MRQLTILFLVATLGPISALFGQTEIAIRNNTRNNLTITAIQYGTYTLAGSEWQLEANALEWWAEDTTIFTTQRQAPVVPDGDTVFFDLKVTSLNDTLLIKLRLIGTPSGSTLAYGIAGQGLAEVWYSDSSFHEVQAVMGGRDVLVKFKPYNDDAAQSQDILFAIHDTPIYEIDPADAQNPHILNFMTFNAQMLPLGISGLKEANLRADLIPLNISPYQDVVVFQELMDSTARLQHLVPGMAAAGFTYYTIVLNDTSTYFPSNGGVIFFSKWPIETSADWRYTVCGPSSADCAALKGVQYIRINKLGTKYHLLGTHMDAGSQQPDLDARQTQMGEIRRFIEAQNIPSHEAVLFGGDFNISPFTLDNQFQQIVDTLNPVLPNYTGFYSSTDGNVYPGKIIDHIWAFKDYLVPLEATNYVVTFRSVDDRMWEMSWLGDHRPVLGRFVFPDISLNSEPSAICPGDSLYLAVNTTLPTTFTWQKDGLPYATTTNQVLHYPASAPDGGSYTCNINYSATFGGMADSLNRFFHLNGEETINVDLDISFGNVVVDSVLCLLGVGDITTLEVKMYPNPANETLVLEAPGNNGEPLTVTMTDLQGKTVAKTILGLGATYLAVGHLPVGVYLVHIAGSQGTTTQKVLVAH